MKRASAMFAVVLAWVFAGPSAPLTARPAVQQASPPTPVLPQGVQLVTSVETLLMVALGGPGTLAGPVLGAGVIVFLKNFVSVYTKRWLLILGAVYIGVILFAPRGVLGAFRTTQR